MKTLSLNNETTSFDSFTFEALTTEELSMVKGGKLADSYADLD